MMATNKKMLAERRLVRVNIMVSFRVTDLRQFKVATKSGFCNT